MARPSRPRIIRAEAANNGLSDERFVAACIALQANVRSEGRAPLLRASLSTARLGASLFDCEPYSSYQKNNKEVNQDLWGEPQHIGRYGLGDVAPKILCIQRFG